MNRPPNDPNGGSLAPEAGRRTRSRVGPRRTRARRRRFDRWRLVSPTGAEVVSLRQLSRRDRLRVTAPSAFTTANLACGFASVLLAFREHFAWAAGILFIAILLDIADGFVAAWAKGDAKGLAALHAENAIRSTPEGVVYVGRAAIEKAFAEAFAGPYKDTKLVVTPGEERAIGADVIVTSGTYELTGGNVPPGAVTKGIYVNTAVRQGGRWLLVSSSPVGVTARPPAQP